VYVCKCSISELDATTNVMYAGSNAGFRAASRTPHLMLLVFEHMATPLRFVRSLDTVYVGDIDLCH
jgi:hypothetical protein